MIRRVWLSLGSNLGDRWQFLADALEALHAQSQVTDVRCSEVFETEPVGGPAQDDYLNCIVELRSELSAMELLSLAQQLEEAAGRQRRERWGPRTLDVDIVGIEGETHSSGNLVIPHPRASERAFVVYPLTQLVDPHVALGCDVSLTNHHVSEVRRVEPSEYPQGWRS